MELVQTRDDEIDLMAVCEQIQKEFKTATGKTIADIQKRYAEVLKKIRRLASKEK